MKRRIKPKNTPTQEELQHAKAVRELPCIGCGAGPCEAHHVMQSFPEKRGRRDHRFVIPACPDCHRGRWGIHGIGNEAKWAEGKGIDVIQTAITLWAERSL